MTSIVLLVHQAINLKAPEIRNPYHLEKRSNGNGGSLWVIHGQKHSLKFDKSGVLLYTEEQAFKECRVSAEFCDLWDYTTEYLKYEAMRESIDPVVSNPYGIGNHSDQRIFNMLKAFDANRALWDQDIVEISKETNTLKYHAPRLFPKFGYVYLISEPLGSFKIGKTENLDQRIKTHGVKLPYKDLKYTHTFPCGDMSQTEAALHRFYTPQRLNGEWFLLNESQLECFKQIQYCDDIETMLDALPLPTEELRAQAKTERNK